MTRAASTRSAPAWHGTPAADVLEAVESSAAGLTSAEAATRLVRGGPNELIEAARRTRLQIAGAQFKSVIIWVLIGAGVLSGFMGELVDTIAILTIVLLNAAIGFYQEQHAEEAIAALRKMSAPHAKVRRDGAVASVEASALVVGDILEVEPGDVIAADARVLTAASLRCVESALTGESEAVNKQGERPAASDAVLGDRDSMLFMGTSVAAGTGTAVIVATGMRTELGHIATLLDGADAGGGTPLQQKLDAFGRMLVWVAMAVVALLVLLGLLRGTALAELSMTAISLAVAAVPEGLPAVVTVALSAGVMRMARRRALVRRLGAVETLGQTSVICTDKTGTLTVGEMTVRALYVGGTAYDVTGSGYGPDGEVHHAGARAGAEHAAPLLELASVLLGCNNAHLVREGDVWMTIGDPTEGAMLVAGSKAGGDRAEIDRTWPKRHEIPFDSDRKRSAVIRGTSEHRRAFVNGAPDALLQRCVHLFTGSVVRPITDDDRVLIQVQITTMAKQALRVLGAAYRDLPAGEQHSVDAEIVERDLVFVGLTGMYDPPRPEATDAIARGRAAGIRIVMITGDHPQTAAAIATEIGIASDASALSGAELEALSDDELRKRVADVAVFARVTAAHKLRIVGALIANGEVVAMTGDGVNDAPAIKGADIGIAMGIAGTEVTKQASDMIITDDNFATIVAAVEEGRGIYDNIRKTLQYLLAGNAGELVLMTVCVAAGLPLPLLPIHLLWINLVTDGLPALCLATDPIDPDVMSRRPRDRDANITDRAFVGSMVMTGILTAAVTLGVYLVTLRSGDIATARTYAFTVLVFAELLRAFGARSERTSVWRIPLSTNPALVGVVVASIALQVASQHNATLGGFLRTTPMPLADCAMLLGLGAIPLLCLEAWKVVGRRVGSGRPA